MYQKVYEFSQSMWIFALLTVPVFAVISITSTIISYKINKTKNWILLILSFYAQYVISFAYFMSISAGVLRVNSENMKYISKFYVLYVTDFSFYYFYIFCPLFYIFLMFSSAQKFLLSRLFIIANFIMGISFFFAFYAL